jgi:transposase
MGKIRKTYSKDFKLEVVTKYLDEGWSESKIVNHFKIAPSMLYRWTKYYKEEGAEGLEEKRGKAKGLHKDRPRKNSLTPEQELERKAIEAVVKAYKEGKKYISIVREEETERARLRLGHY